MEKEVEGCYLDLLSVLISSLRALSLMLDQWFSHLSVPQNHVEGVPNSKGLDPTSDSVAKWGRVQEFGPLASS